MATSSLSTGYIIRAKANNFNEIQNYLDKIWNNIDFYKDEPTIVVQNLSELPQLEETDPIITLKNNSEFYNKFEIIDGNLTDKFTGIKIFDLSGGKKTASIEYLKNYLNVDTVEFLPEEYGIMPSKHNEDILIVVGPVSIVSNEVENLEE